jgi:hypothetical protein
MIALLLAAALHLTPPEQFFCEPRWPTLQQCMRKTREWICQPNALRYTDEPHASYMRTVRQERTLICKRKRLAP